jgi:nitrogen fixation NifU-like protein
MMLDLVIGRESQDALRLCDIFMRMIKGGASEQEIEELDEAGALQNVSHMPARVKCAVLGWRTLDEMLRSKGGSVKLGNASVSCAAHN